MPTVVSRSGVPIPEPIVRMAEGLPPTDNAPVNVATGAMVVGATGWGATEVTDGPWVIGISMFLNGVGQVIKPYPWFNQNRWIFPVFFVVAFVVGYVVLFQGDAARTFLNASVGALRAMADYKADKIAGTNILAPAHDLAPKWNPPPAPLPEIK